MPPPAYTPAQWLALKGYVRQCADLYGLKDWRIFVSEVEGPEEGAAASCNVPEDLRMAEIRFAAEFADQKHTYGQDNDEARRRIVLHELTHCHLERPWEFAMTAEVAMGSEGGRVFRRAFFTMMEVAVDSIAAAIAPFLPLPPPELGLEAYS